MRSARHERVRCLPVCLLALIAGEPLAQQCGSPGIDLAKGCWGAPFRHLDADDGVATYRPNGTLITNPNECVPGWPLKNYSNTAAFPTFPAETTTALHMSVIPKGTKRGWVIVWGEPLVYTTAKKTSELPAGFPAWGRYPFPSNLPQPLDPEEYMIRPVRQHQYAIFDPENPAATWMNFCEDLPANQGDLFCAGHAWNANGDLLVAGGTLGWPHGRAGSGGQTGFEGSPLCMVWVPPMGNSDPGGTWIPQPLLTTKRWYPSVMALGPDLDAPIGQQDKMVVLGGIEDGSQSGPPVNSYQVWEPPLSGQTLGSWETIPGTLIVEWPSSGVMLLENYPRGVLFSAANLGPDGLGRLIFGGWPKTTELLSQYDTFDPMNPTGLWLNDPTWQMSARREYGAMVLLPIVAGGLKDRALVLGGYTTFFGTIHASVEQWNGNLGSPSWIPRPSMPVGLYLQNVVATPDSRIVVLGGERSDVSSVTGQPGWTGGLGFCSRSPNYTPFEYDPTRGDGNEWRTLNAHEMIRDYHSTDVLVPSGRILSGGGENRKVVETASCPNTVQRAGPWDYELLTPYYLSLLEDPATRPVINTPGPTYEFQFGYGQTVRVDYSFGTPSPEFTVDRVVLVRPGSATHHSDGNQRVVQLNFQHVGDGALDVTVPGLTDGILPRGIYMLFLLSLQGGILVPSKAEWARVF